MTKITHLQGNDLSKINCTSWFGGIVRTSIKKIEDTFGITIPWDDIDGKITYHAGFEADGVVFTIYDWYEALMNEYCVVDLHIGAKSKSDTQRVVDILKEYGFSASVNN